MVEAAEAARVVNATCYHVRGYPLVEQMRADVAAGAVGELVVRRTGATSATTCSFPASGWRDRPRAVRAVVRRRRPRDALARPRRVRDGPARARGARGLPLVAGGPLEDYAALLLRLDGGVVGLARRSQRARRAARTSSSSSAKATTAGLTWDQEEPNELLARPATARGSSTRIRARSEAARRLARYPAGHARGLRRRFRNVFADVYRAIAGEPHEPFPTFARRPPRRRDRRGRRQERARGRAGSHVAVSASRRRTAGRQARRRRDAIRTSDAREQQRRERVHLGRDPELHLRVDVDRQRVVRADQEVA